MKKITFGILLTILPFFLIAQQCPDPIADSEQYFCTGSSHVLNDLTVTAIGTLTWYDDAMGTNVLPGTTPIVNGTTYYVSQTDVPNCTESNLVPVTAYLQSLHFDVNPSSCIYLGNNVYLVDPTDTVQIDLLDINNAPVNANWTPVGAPLYIDPGLVNSHFSWAAGWSTLYFGNANPDEEYTFTVTTRSGGACPPTSQELTIFTGTYIYDEFCYGASTTLADIGIPGNNITWYSDAAGTNVIPDTTTLVGNTTYYAGFGDPSCTDLLPVRIDYQIEAPLGISDQPFCTAATWATFGIIEDDDKLSDLNICGENLTWYDATGTTVLPSNTVLVDGSTYYVTQNVGGCESEPLEVQVTEQVCACSKNNGFENQDGTSNSEGITVYHNPQSDYGNFQVCNMNFLYNNTITLGPPESPAPGTLFTTYAALTTAGNDPTLMQPGLGIPFPRTSPLGDGCSLYSMRLNRNIPSAPQDSGIVTMRKEMIAGEVLTFDFAIIMENPVHHIPNGDEPYFQVKVYDQNNNVIESRCIKANNGDCILNEVPNPTSTFTLLYSDWSCVKMNTLEVQGEPIRVEFSASTCAPDYHFSYVYVDNIYVGDDGPGVCSNSSFGYMALDGINPGSSPTYEPCSIMEVSTQGECEAFQPVLNPIFPFDVCGTYSAPISAPGNNPGGANSILMKIYKNGTQVGSSTTRHSTTASSFCFEIDEPRDFNPGVPMYGYFTLEASTVYDMDCGIQYSFPLESSINAFKICPVAGCPQPLTDCSNTTGQTIFDLTLSEPEITANYSPNEVIVSYYLTATDAHAKTNAIANPTSFTVTAPSFTTLYARLDFDWAGLNAGPEPEDCYDIVPLEVIAGEAPIIPADLTMTPLTLCPDASLTVYEFDLTDVETELVVNLPVPSDYTWDFFETLNDANLNQNPIPNPTTYPSTIGPGQTQIIWVRVEGPDGCFSITSFELIVYPEIVYNTPTDYELCDDQTPDGFTQFDLTTKVTQMTNNDPNLDVTFHLTQTDAEGALAPLPLTYTNTTNPQTIFVRIEDNNGCFIIAQFDLIVNPNPVPGPVNDMAQCDVNGTGQGQFNLSIPEGEILNGQTGMTVRFYQTQAQADAGLVSNQLPNPYTNTTNPQTIYYRLEDGTTGCYTTGTFEIEVIASPAITDPISDYILCDNDQNGTEDFDLTSKEGEILNTINPTTVTITYYNTFADADAAINPINNPSVYPSSGNETIYVRVEFNDGSGCYSIGEFLIDLAPPLNFTTPSDFELCEDAPGSGQAVFDFSTLIPIITNNNPNLIVTFYDNLADAQAGTAQLPLLYTNQSSPETIFVRIEENGGCFATTDFDLIVNPLPVAGPVNNMAQCDTDQNGTQVFDLTVPRDEILNGQTGYTVSFYRTQAQAQMGSTLNRLPLSFTFTGTQRTIYYRMEDDATGCFVTGSFTIEIVGLPPITDPISDYALCDNDQNGTEVFDLSSKENEILNTIPPASVIVTYHNTFNDADTGTNAIPTPQTYTSGGETIYVRVEYNNPMACYIVGQFELVIHPQVAFNAPEPLIVCDEGVANGIASFDLSIATSQITGNDPNLAVTYYETQAQAVNGNPANQLTSPYTNTTPYNQTIYVRIVNLSTGCFAVAPLDLQVNEAPTAIEPQPLTYCDEDNDGFGSFTLTDADNEITGGASGVIVTYHTTQANANNGVFPLASPFFNTVAYTQIIWARVESPGVACFNVVPVTLQVLDSPQTEEPDDLVACDFNGNNTGTFDLTQVEPQLMGNIPNPQNYTIQYYANQTDLNNDSPIPVPSSYTSTGSPQTIFVKVTDPANGCFSIEEFEISAVDLPQIFHPTALELCDVNNPGDEIEEFNLNLATLEITGGDTSITITYHETQADADAGINPLPMLYTNTMNNQTIYIRAESAEGCVVTQGYTLTLIVNPLPSPREPDPLEVCDPSNDGFSMFNLEDATAQILNNEPNTTITYHQTLSDAEMGIFPVASPYGNIVAYQQTIYARAENDITGCYSIVELLLIVHDTPNVPLNLPDIVECSPDQTEIGIIFDLTQNEALIFGLQNPSQFDISYHLTEQDAQNNVSPISDPSNFANTSNPQDLWVRLGNTNTECGTVRKFTIRVELAPEIGGPFELEACNDAIFTEFDLTTMDRQFTLDQPGLDVQYYETSMDAQNGTNQIDPDNAYTNTQNPQTIYVRVLHGDSGCSAYSTLTLIVNPTPDIETPSPIEMCDTDGDGFAQFDLSIRETEILNGEVGTFSYHLTMEDAENNLNPILNYNNYRNVETPQQTIYVRVTNPNTDCYSIVELLLIVNDPPIIGEITDYEICEVNTDGFAVFDLTTKIPEILDGQDPTLFNVKFYENQIDAQNGVNAIMNPQAYTNMVNPQEIFVRVESGSTECYEANASFFLRVLEGAEANSPEEPLVACEDELGTGIGTFDLTSLDQEIMGTQQGPVFVITYHPTLEDAQTGDNPIPDPNSYQSATGTIYARVTNTDTGCYALAVVDLKVIQLPVIAFQDSYRLCLDAEGNPLMEEFGEVSPPLLDTGLGGSDYIFIWQLDGLILFDETSGSLMATSGGVYTVTVIDVESGCEITSSTTVTVSSPPLEYSAEVTTMAFSNPHTIEATASGLGTYVFQLDDGPTQSSGTFTNVQPGDHTVTISDVNGCGSVTIDVGAIDYPLFFTPNGDGYHDTWNIKGIESIPTAKIYIFDRHGKLLKQLSPNGPGWDGTYNGNPMPSSDYWFRVIYQEEEIEKEFKGHFTLKR